MWVTLGVSNILIFFSVATRKNRESGENPNAVTGPLKLKWAITTFLMKLIMRANPSTSIVIRVRPSGESSTLAMLDRFWKGRVYETLLYDTIVISRVLLT